MKFVCSLLTLSVLALVDGRLVRRQVPGLPRPPVIPPVGPPRIPGPVIPGVNPLNGVPIISYVNDNNYDGSYKYSYETGNGIFVQEEGVLANPGQPDLEAQTARGSYSYTAPDGQVITVNWYADDTGFHAEGNHIPKVGQYPVPGAPVPVPGPVLGGRPPVPFSPVTGAPAPQFPAFSRK